MIVNEENFMGSDSLSLMQPHKKKSWELKSGKRRSQTQSEIERSSKNSYIMRVLMSSIGW